MRESLPSSGALPPEPSAAQPPTPAASVRFEEKVVISHERKDRGGKTVTVVRGVLASGAALDEFARELRKALGTSAAIDGEAIVVGGAPGERLAAWLRVQGAPNVVVGN